MKQGSYSIAILTDYMLHPTLDRFLPVEENLGLLKLIRFIRDELSWQVDVFQASPIPQRVFDGVRVFGIDQDPDHLSMFPGLNSVFVRRSLGYDLRIYYHWHLAAPKVCLMAMACGLPVIAGFAGGLAEHVVHGWNGYLLYPAVANVFQALLELAGNEGLRRRMGENARKLAEGYPESLWKQRWTCLLKRILAKPLKCNALERR